MKKIINFQLPEKGDFYPLIDNECNNKPPCPEEENKDINRFATLKDLNNYFKINDLLGGLTSSQQNILKNNIGIESSYNINTLTDEEISITLESFSAIDNKTLITLASVLVFFPTEIKRVISSVDASPEAGLMVTDASAHCADQDVTGMNVTSTLPPSAGRVNSVFSRVKSSSAPGN